MFGSILTVRKYLIASIVSFGLAVLSGLSMVVFALLPIYGLVGKKTTDADAALHHASNLVTFFIATILFFFAAMIVFLVLGILSTRRKQ